MPSTPTPPPPPLLAIGLLLVVVLALTGVHALDKPSEFVKGKICIGTNGRMSVPSNREHHYRSLRDRYSNCTYVDGNLELTWLQDPNLDLSFLQYIREVTGYVLISHVDVKRTILPRLQIIRGRTLFKLNVRKEEFALMVTLSKMHNLELPALRDILAGSVGIFSNYNLCHIKTINWDEIITDPDAKHVYVYNFTSPERECPSCDNSCAQGCWGEGPHNCQQFSKVNCSPQCYKGRCFGPKPRECCHLFCAGGCKGPKQSDCIACRNFYDDGVCTHECPPMQKYNSISYSWETNPDGKYAYGATCVKNCPEHLLKDNGACVRSCPPKKKALNGECVPCDGPCPKTCQGVATVHSGNIDSFKDCTIIEGSISILDTSFNGFQQVYANFTFGPRYGRMHPDKLEVFSTLKEVTGYINIQGQDTAFTNLSYFRNLEVIGGRTLTEFFSSLYIVKTSLRSLGLRSLQKVHSGSISIVENQYLCYVNEINWKRIKKSTEHIVLINNNNPKENCTAEGHVCHEECSTEGCWGPSPDQCLSCAHFRLVNTCLKSCDSVHGMYEAATGVCKPCHEECADTCTGAGPDNCTACKNVRDGPYCVPQCPQTKYDHEGQCKPCHDHCLDGCSGPSEFEGPNGCHTCKKGIMLNQTVRCIAANEPCPEGFFYERFISPNMQENPRGTGNCRLCHPRCLKCTGYGFHESHCQECRDFKRGEQCEDECPRDFYVVPGSKDCLPCSNECRSCFGPTESQCTSCRNYKLFLDGGPGDNSTAFNCTDSCPPEAPHKIFPQDNSDPYCSEKPLQHALRAESPKTTVIIGAVIAIALSLMLLVGAIGWLYHQKTKAKHSATKMALALTGLEDNEPLRPTNVKPNLAKLRIVKEAELRKCHELLGYGAFGTVYKGVWYPEGENVKIPVAIKVLREGTGANTSKEFLEEAYIMATVEHPNLLQLLAVCMTSQMMLVTQLMPLGCLLDYVRNFKEKIGSKPLLNWCTQIARGMAYLEERRLVHRDLAARNVLVQTPNCVKITDFGLAKLLDINEDEYKAAGGKMPIKWLALECIQHRIFTHKSDVWAFGVTVWELLTYGARPYEHVPARDVPELLEKGERLSQPSICSIDVYMLMIKCWMLDAESRPSFKELSDEFAKMARDPGRYLAIAGDKHMRLPAFTVQVQYPDEKELIRNLSSALDGPEALVDADEYLQPKSRAPMFGPAPSPSPPSSLGNCSSSQQQPPAPWTDLGYPNCIPVQGIGSGSSGGDTIQTTTSAGNALDPSIAASRYCSDPLKMLSAKEEDGVDGAGQSNRAQVGSLKLELPLDEDDYLMPSPQPHGLNSATTATAYMDLIGDSKDPTGGFSYPDFLPSNTCVDNPEYHIMNSESNSGLPGVVLSNGLPTVDSIPECSTTGLPILTIVPNGVTDTNGATANPNTTSGIPTNSTSTSSNLDPSGSQTRPYVTHQRSSEEESDHEYYNDLDRLQRELQPLKPFRRNETTV